MTLFEYLFTVLFSGVIVLSWTIIHLPYFVILFIATLAIVLYIISVVKVNAKV